jgi:uncharacterized membrane protein
MTFDSLFRWIYIHVFIGDFKEFIHLILRWTHVFAGILWVGTTYYFTWLDGRFSEFESNPVSSPVDPNRKSEKNVWMVHSGGFYRVEKQTVPNVIPEKLHWFKWEAALTWLSGILLFAFVYYHGKIMVDLEDARMKEGMAVFWSICLIMFGWAIYDALLSKLFLKNEFLGVSVCYAVIVVLTYGLFYYFSRRAACLQLGAMLGTIMTSNVWMRILPAQRRMVAALKEGREPDQAEARRAKTRARHNTFIVIPVVFLMLSPHFPGAYNWITVSIMILAGWAMAKWLRRA